MAIRIIALLSLGGFAGCGSSNKALDYANVSGTVNYGGKPLDKGTVIFSVAGEPPTQCDVLDGKYAGRAAVGSNTVRISAMRKSAGAKNITPQMAQQMKEQAQRAGNTDFDPTLQNVIPPEWGANSKQSRVVEAGGANNFDFDVKAK